MRIEIKQVTTWEDVVNAARFTQHKAPLGHEPSDKFKAQCILSEHSPLRELVYRIYMYDVPFFVVSHLVRHHEGINIYVATSRPDITGKPVSRHEQRKDDLTDVMFTMNAQAILNVSRLRLCNCAEKATRMAWEDVIMELRKIDRILADKCVPSCIYRGGCPELKCCGFDKAQHFPSYRKLYWESKEPCF